MGLEDFSFHIFIFGSLMNILEKYLTIRLMEIPKNPHGRGEELNPLAKFLMNRFGIRLGVAIGFTATQILILAFFISNLPVSLSIISLVMFLIFVNNSYHYLRYKKLAGEAG